MILQVGSQHIIELTPDRFKKICVLDSRNEIIRFTLPKGTTVKLFSYSTLKSGKRIGWQYGQRRAPHSSRYEKLLERECGSVRAHWHLLSICFVEYRIHVSTYCCLDSPCATSFIMI